MRQVRWLIPVLSVFVLASCSSSLEPTPQALPTEFPNETDSLISPEGQAIIDAVLEGRLEAPDLSSGPLEVLPESALTPQGTVPAAVRRPWASSMSSFLAYRSARNPSYANWSTDKCSNSPDSTPVYNFTNPCIRHDYGYRNWKKYSAFTDSAKRSIDDKFLADMKAHCATRNVFIRGECYRWAYIYYGAVRALG